MLGNLSMGHSNIGANARADVSAKGIAVIGGTGRQGFGLALRWAKAGGRIFIGSREQAKAQAAADRVREVVGSSAQVEGLENAEAASRTDLIILTVPFEAQTKTLKSLKTALNPGDTLVDVTVPLESAVGGNFTRVLGVWAGSAAEQAARVAGEGVHVVSAFHNIGSGLLTDLTKPLDCDVIVCGDHSEAKERVRSLVALMPPAGFVDGGPLENSRIVESLTALLVSVNIRYKAHSVGIRVTGLPDSAR